MKFFGYSKDEIEKMEQDIEKRENDLKRNEIKLENDRKSLDLEKSYFQSAREAFNAELDKFCQDKRNIEMHRQKLLELEARAKAGFAEAQNEAFKEIIEKRMLALNTRQSDLENFSKQLSERLKSIIQKEGEIAERELAVTEREQLADAGFADKIKSIADEAKRQHEANLKEADRLKKFSAVLDEKDKCIVNKIEELSKREQSLIDAKRKQDSEFIKAKLEFEQELANRETEFLANLESEMGNIRKQRLETIRAIEEEERARIRAEIVKERKSWEEKKECQQNVLKRESEANAKKEGELNAKESYLIEKENDLDAGFRNLDIRSSELDETIEERVEARKKSLDSIKSEMEEEMCNLRDELKSKIAELGAFELLWSKLPEENKNDPTTIILELKNKTKELRELKEKLANCPSEEMRERYKSLEEKTKDQRKTIMELQQEIDGIEETKIKLKSLEIAKTQLESEKKSLEQRLECWESAAIEAQEELKRLRSAYKLPEEESARRKEIEIPYISVDKIKQPEKIDIDEIKWLENIRKSCDEYGLSFHPRILKAFHTALKTAEWSPITILAGVSGTGKSELPRLYSHFGGLMFESLSVQPNWDSQESMLGFFNSIDNKFDAQPVLRFLAQSQKKCSKDYPAGLSDTMCMVLLDEMNLAHPELYFAEFLSKLELRRGMKGTEVPCLPVKIGAGLPPYQLPLGRNVLWVGTMNQDETTKSLSDKVLDRSIIIHFPRPISLKRREGLKPLDSKNRGDIIHRETFFKWFAQKSQFSSEQISPYKTFVEEMNQALGVVGRAIGHRVWQSVEYYMANYPDVRRALNEGGGGADLQKAMHIAFEDQLVQKIMPKLRGIDTRGKSKTECLDKIQSKLNEGIEGIPFNLNEDFSLACELGYGQFMWQSANYLSNMDYPDNTSVEKNSAGNLQSNENIGSMGTPPEWFMPNDQNREQYWNMKTPEGKANLISGHENAPKQ